MLRLCLFAVRLRELDGARSCSRTALFANCLFVFVCQPRSHELEMLVILRMNRDFMEFMRTNYPDVARKLADQHFGFTPIPGVPTAAAAHKPAAYLRPRRPTPPSRAPVRLRLRKTWRSFDMTLRRGRHT